MQPITESTPTSARQLYLSAMPQTVGKTIKQRREAMGLTQLALAERLDVREGTVRRWESDKTDIRGANLIALSQALKLDPRELGLEIPDGWEMVSADWIRKRLDDQDVVLAKILARLDRMAGR